jgi:hypothetical protein
MNEPRELTENERLAIVVREADGPNPPQLLKELVDAINALIPNAADGAGSWVRGWGQAKVAKAAEIKANVLQKVAEIEQDRVRLIHERDQSLRESEHLGQQARFAHEQKMYELRTQRLSEAVACIVRLRELGAEVELKVVNHLAKELLAAAREKPV